MIFFVLYASFLREIRITRQLSIIYGICERLPLKKCLSRFPAYHPGRDYYKIIPWNIFFCNTCCTIITKIIPPENFLCNAAAAGVSLFTRQQAKEFASQSDCFVSFTNLTVPKIFP